MTIYFLDRCVFTPTANGSGTWTVSSNVVGYLTPVNAGAVDGQIYNYFAQSDDRTEWEVGTGTYTVAGTTLSRTPILSSNANAVVSFTNVPKVYMGGPLAGDFDITWSNTRLAKTANYTVDPTDKGKTIALGGSAFFTLTINAASGYLSDFGVMLVNEDTGRGKTIAINGLSNFILYPGQTAFVFNQNNTWQVDRQYRWKCPGGTLNVYCDFTNGADTNDGLASGSGNAKKTLQAALDTIVNDFDLKGTSASPTLVVVNMAASTTDTTGVHFSAHSFIGAQGGAAIKILGGSGATISTTSANALSFNCNVQVQLSGLTLQTTTSGDCIAANLGAAVEIIGNVTFGACAGSHISAHNGAKVYINSAYTISGNATTAHIITQDQGLCTGGSVTTTVSANVTMTYFCLASNFSSITLPSMTYSLGAFSVTAKRYEADNLSLISSNGGGANYFPGNVAGTTSNGGVYV